MRPREVVEEWVRQFNAGDAADAHMTTEVLTCLSFDSKAKVDAIADAAVAAGGTEACAPQGSGLMFGRSFNDLDGHIWEVIWMNPRHIQQG